MRRRSWYLLITLYLVFNSFDSAWVLAQPRLVLSKMSGYDVGDRVDRDVTVFNARMEPVPLLDAFNPEARVVVLVIFGGAAAKVPDGEFRGELWCVDTFDDLGIQRALVNYLRGFPAQVIGVAVPPVFSSGRYGFEERVFLEAEETSTRFREAFRMFVDRTEALKRKTLIPYEAVLYDPRARLLQNMKGKETGPGYGKILDWQGRFKWKQDPRKYGAPTIWILDGRGKVLREPFWGNDYGSVPPLISYGFRELREAIEAFLNGE